MKTLFYEKNEKAILIKTIENISINHLMRIRALNVWEDFVTSYHNFLTELNNSIQDLIKSWSPQDEEMIKFLSKKIFGYPQNKFSLAAYILSSLLLEFLDLSSISKPAIKIFKVFPFAHKLEKIIINLALKINYNAFYNFKKILIEELKL